MYKRSLTNLGATKWSTVHKRRIKGLWVRFNSLHSSFCCPSCTICALCDTSVQIQNTLLCENKNTFTLLSGKSTTSLCLFMCSRNLITESLTTHGEAFSSIIVSLCRDWPRCKCSEPKRKPSLVPGSKPYTRSRSLQITRDFLFLYLGPCPSSVCVYSVQKTQQKTTGFIWDTWPTITHKKNKSSVSLLCVEVFLFRVCPALTSAS